MQLRALILAALFLLREAGETPADKGGVFLFLPEGGTLMVYGGRGKSLVLRQGPYLDAETLKSIRRLASGLRIVTAADDQAGFAVAERVRAIVLEIERRSVNEEDTRNYLRFLEGELSRQQRILGRVRGLLLRASGGILGSEDRELVQTEIDELLREIDAHAASAGFNKERPLAGLDAGSLGVRDIDVRKDSILSLAAVDGALERISRLRALAGSRDRLLELRIKGRRLYSLDLQAAASRIRGLNLAEEISTLLKNHTLLRLEHGVILTHK